MLNYKQICHRINSTLQSLLNLSDIQAIKSKLHILQLQHKDSSSRNEGKISNSRGLNESSPIGYKLLWNMY